MNFSKFEFSIFALINKYIMKKLVLLLFFFTLTMHSQVGIGTTTPNASSILDVTSTTNGILVPRLTSAQRIAIASPAQSLMVYDTDVDLYYYFSVSNNSWTAVNVGSVKNIATTLYTISVADNGRILDFSAATTITVTIPDTLPIGFQASITQSGTGNAALVASGSMILNNRYGGTQTSGQWAKIGLEVRAINSTVISGDVK
jgi:hypothetical protein